MSDSTNLGSTIVALPIEDVRPHPMHYRTVGSEKVKELAANMKTVKKLVGSGTGQLEAAIVVEDAPGFYYLYAGHHRREALVLNGEITIDARVAADWSTAAQIASMVGSNWHAPETELERSRGVQLLAGYGIKPVDVAALAGEKQDRIAKAARGMKVVNDDCACEDMTIDRLIAIAQFEDDPEAVAKLLKCTEAEWPGLERKLTADRTRMANVAKAEATIKAAGCELIKVALGTSPAGLRYLTVNKVCPEGATAACIRTSPAWTEVDIVWYGPSPTAEKDAERQAQRDAERQQAELIAAELKKAQTRRLEFVAASLLTATKQNLRSALVVLAEWSWEAGILAGADQLEDTPLADATGFLNRVYASVLLRVESSVADVLEMSGNDYYLSHYGQLALDYFEVLDACGFTPTDVENGVIAEIEEALKDEEDPSEPDPSTKCPTCDGDGRPYAADGSRNGNAKCETCGGTGVVASGSVDENE